MNPDNLYRYLVRIQAEPGEPFYAPRAVSAGSPEEAAHIGSKSVGDFVSHAMVTEIAVAGSGRGWVYSAECAVIIGDAV